MPHKSSTFKWKKPVTYYSAYQVRYQCHLYWTQNGLHHVHLLVYSVYPDEHSANSELTHTLSLSHHPHFHHHSTQTVQFLTVAGVSLQF
jgi:hypothetical protein